MGITTFGVQQLKKVMYNNNINSVLEFGAQNMFIDATQPPPYATEWYLSRGIKTYHCIDMTGENNSIKADWCKPLLVVYQYDLVTDFGSSEHSTIMDEHVIIDFDNGVKSAYSAKAPEEGSSIADTKCYYTCWLNKHNALAIGGFMVNENPMTGHWPGHGFFYLLPNFYQELCKIADYEVIETGEACAMGNCETGKNIYSILKKTGNRFPSFDEFNQLPFSFK